MPERSPFRFETLLRLRAQRENEQKRVVADRLRAIHTIETQRDTLLARIVQQTDALRSVLTSGPLPVDRVRLGRHWVARLRQAVLEMDAEIAGHRAVLAQERQELAARRKQTEVLARLKERQLDAMRRAADRREQAELDDLNTMRFAFAAGVSEASC